MRAELARGGAGANFTRRTRAAFSLIEVVLALGIAGFSLVGILGLMPVAVESGRLGMMETRACHLAETTFATLRGQPFTAARCFGSDPLDLSQLTNNSNDKRIFYVAYDPAPDNSGNVAAAPRITPASTSAPADAVYTISLEFDNQPVIYGTERLSAGKANRVIARVSSGAQARGTAASGSIAFSSVIAQN